MDVEEGLRPEKTYRFVTESRLAQGGLLRGGMSTEPRNQPQTTTKVQKSTGFSAEHQA